MSRIAAISDAHLPDRSDTIKDAVLDWALGELRGQSVDLLAVAGDMTSLGTVAAATRLRNKLERLGIPFLFTPGNAELRTPAQTRQVLETLHTPSETAEMITLDSSRMHLTDTDRDRLCVLCQRAEPIFTVTHCPPGFLPQEDQILFRMALDAGKILPLLTGHIHRDQVDGRRQSIRGLDPDRACAAPAGIAIFDNSQGPGNVRTSVARWTIPPTGATTPVRIFWNTWASPPLSIQSRRSWRRQKHTFHAWRFPPWRQPWKALVRLWNTGGHREASNSPFCCPC